MKKNFLLSVLLCAASCGQSLPQDMAEQMKTNEEFWKQKNTMILKDKEDKRYPIPNGAKISDKRYNSIRINSGGVEFEVYINDVLLFNFKGEASQHQGGTIGSHVSNPMLLTSGTHEIKVRIYPPMGKTIMDDETGGVRLAFLHHPFDNVRDYNVFDEKMNGHSGIYLNEDDTYWVDRHGNYGEADYVEGHYAPKTPLPLKGLPMYEWRSTFEADVPFDFVGWRNSVNLKKESEDHKEFGKELKEAYANIYQIFKDRDTQKLLHLVKEREELVANTLFYGDKEKKERVEEFVNLIQNKDFEVAPLYEETFRMEFQGYGNLVTLINKADKEGIIRLINKKNKDEIIYLDFLFQRKKTGDKLSVI